MGSEHVEDLIIFQRQSPVEKNVLIVNQICSGIGISVLEVTLSIYNGSY